MQCNGPGKKWAIILKMGKIPPLRKQTECLGGRISKGVNSLTFWFTQLGFKLSAHANTNGRTIFWLPLFSHIGQSATLSLNSSLPQLNWEVTQEIFNRRVSYSEWFLSTRFFHILELFNTILTIYFSTALFLKRSCMQKKHVRFMQHSSVVAYRSK